MSSSRTLPVPYFTQPTGTSCQGTVLKMMASYLDALDSSSGAGGSSALDIKKSINSDSGRPVSNVTNSHANMKWWLEKNYPRYTFEYTALHNQFQATEKIVRIIDRGFPLLMSVSHERVAGHIVLVTGYSGYMANACSATFKLVVHDPYGEFDPSLRSELYGKNRWKGGLCLVAGGEYGPGASNQLDPANLSRRKAGDAAKGSFIMLYPSGRK